MKIQFDAHLDYQRQAIDSVVGVFEGQEICHTNFTVNSRNLSFKELEGEIGYGNRLKLLDEEIHQNIQKIQRKNGLEASSDFNKKNFHLSVEMETGTGKTYVYLRSIFELNRQYGFTKFIIVVPSIAIKEGVYKTLQMTEKHFKSLYDNVNFDYFVYDSAKLTHVRSFATNTDIQIMVINIDAFRKSFTDEEAENKANIIHRAHDRMNGMKPIEFIQQTHPIVIIDEPQSVDTTAKSQQAIESLNPLCTLRYSATHVDKHHMLYRLNSIDAYEQKLVKQIEVAGIEVTDGHNKPYIKLISVNNKKSLSAKIEIDSLSQAGAIKRKILTIKAGDDLFDKSGEREIYRGYIIDEISCAQDNEHISFTAQGGILRLGDAIGDADQDQYKRLQIRATIEEHLDKELRLRSRGIKVLSLFFIDKVANYRFYDSDSNPQKGKFAIMFEEEYAKAIAKPKYRTLFDDVDLTTPVADIHNGYFSTDKKGIFKDTSGKTQGDESAYNLIMKDKEKLLSFESKLKFIFSHSALKEGWDNPNVFQICTLNETNSVLKKRQEIGRGLRIAVNQQGERVHGFDVNTLTVMANESYDDFAKQLQKEIEEDEGFKFGIVEAHLFANIPVATNENGQIDYLGMEKSSQIYNYLKDKNYIDSKGKVEDSLKDALDKGELELPEEFEPIALQITDILKKTTKNINIKNHAKKTKVTLNKAVFLSEDFKQLWDKIKYRTSFRVQFNTEELIAQCASEISQTLRINKPRFDYKKAALDIGTSGISATEVQEKSSSFEDLSFTLPDVITYLQNETNLTRKTIVHIINKSGKLGGFKTNPQQFIEQVLQIIRHKMHRLIVDGIQYHKIDNQYYAQELFENNELFGYLQENMIESQKSVFDHTVYDSEVEKEFAKRLENNQDIKLYAKLPSWFKIDTPLGSYNPDWAILVEKDGQEKLYFVIETKGSMFLDALRPDEKAKITCGEKHFEALQNDVQFELANSFDNFSNAFNS